MCKYKKKVTNNLLLLLLLSAFVKLESSGDEIDNIQNLENTILLEIKTWKYTDDKNFNYYLNTNPHAYYQLSGNESKFINIDLILNNIYTGISIGSPPEPILGFFAGKLNTFKIFYYNKTESETINEIKTENDTIIKYSDNFKFNCRNKTYELTGMEFLITQYTSLKLSHSFLGLQISTKDIEKMKKYSVNKDNSDIFNFVESLQKAHCKNLNISNYYWTFYYFQKPKNNVDGIFYFGEPPHVYDPAHYKKENFIEINTEAGYDNLYWGLKFDNIDFVNKTTNKVINIGKYSTVEYSLIYPELNYFITSENFFGRIKKVFFNKFVLKKKDPNYNSSICSEKFVSIIDDVNLISLGNYNDLKGIYDILYCNKSRIIEYGEEKFYNEFPIIKFNHLLLGYSFEFNASDLFYEKDDKVYFLMTIKIDRGDKWILGKTFMKKYQIVFNNDMRTLGFYLNIDKKKMIKPNEIIDYVDEPNNTNTYIIIICVSLVLIIMFIFCFYLFNNGLWICKNRKKANELQLISDESNEIN